MNKKYMLAIAALALAGILSLYLVNASDDSSADSYAADNGDHEVLEKMIEDAIAYMMTGELMDDLEIRIINDADDKNELDIIVIYGGEYVKVFDLPRYIEVSASMLIKQVSLIPVQIFDYIVEFVEDLMNDLPVLGVSSTPKVIPGLTTSGAYGESAAGVGAINILDNMSVLSDASDAYGEVTINLVDAVFDCSAAPDIYGMEISVWTLDDYSAAPAIGVGTWTFDDYSAASGAYGGMVVRSIGAFLDEPVKITIQGDPSVRKYLSVTVDYEYMDFNESFDIPTSTVIDGEDLFEDLYILFILGKEITSYINELIYDLIYS